MAETGSGRAHESPKGQEEGYEVAREAARQRLRDNWSRSRLEALGVEFKEGGRLELSCLGWVFSLDQEALVPCLLPEGRELSSLWQVLVLDYLCAPALTQPGRMVSFAEFPEARSYVRAFQARVIRRLESTVGRDEGALVEAAERCGAVLLSLRPLHYLFRFFPRLEMQLMRHPADDEFPAACNVLLPENVPSLFTVEDAIVAAEKLVSSLEGKSPAD